MNDDQFKTGGFPIGYPEDIRTYYSPVDDVHGKLLDLVKNAKHSLVICMYGFDDDELTDAILEKMEDKDFFVQLTLDKSQAHGVHESKLLAQAQFPGNIVAIGNSEKHAIMHLKMLVIDNSILVTGSTNWSLSGEEKQDNALVVTYNASVAGEATTRISKIHADMLSKAIKE